MLARTEQVFLELRQLARAEHGVVLDHVGRRDLQIAMLTRLQVQHELADGAFHPGQLPLQHRKARTGHLGGGFKVQQAQSLAQIGVILGRTRRARLAPLQDLDVVVLVLAIRHIVRGQVLQARQQVAQFGALGGFGLARFGDVGLQRLDLGLQPVGLGHVLLAHGGADGLGGGVALGQRLLPLGLGGPQVDVQRQNARDQISGVIHPARRPAGDEGFRVVADGSDVVHGVNLRTFEKKPKAVTPRAESGKPLSAFSSVILRRSEAEIGGPSGAEGDLHTERDVWIFRPSGAAGFPRSAQARPRE
ncbi:hypothetical protein D3C86_1223960 [compost metagenome]